MRTLLIPLLLAAPLALARKPVVEPDPPKPTNPTDENIHPRNRFKKVR